MAAQWYYLVNQQQTGPVELDTLREMLSAQSLTLADLVFGPGLTAWTAAGQVGELSNGGQAAAWGNSPSAPMAAHASPLGYRGVETSTHGLTGVSVEMLRQTKPWVRFIAVLTFIAAGLMGVGGLGMLIFGSMSSSSGIPAMGAVYIVLAGVYVMPAIFLNRYASSIGSLLQTQRSSDVEQAMTAQKSFWKFMGILMIVMIGFYVVFGAIVIATKGRF